MTIAESFDRAKWNELGDDEVVTRVVAGDTPMFELLMRRYNQRLYRTVRAILGEDTDAEDVMQQAYLNAYLHLKQFEGRAKFSTWLTRIAVHEALARLRKRRVFVIANDRDDEEEAMNEIRAVGPDPESQAISGDMSEILEKVIAALPERYRSVFVLREIEGMDTAEAADALDVSEDVIKTRLSRGRAMIREELYRRAGINYQSVWPFPATRCNRVVAAVFEMIAKL